MPMKDTAASDRAIRLSMRPLVFALTLPAAGAAVAQVAKVP